LLLVVLALLVCQGAVAQLQNPGLGLGDGSVPHPLSDLPVPPEAYNVQESSVAADYPNQLSFKIELEYPSKSVLDLYSQHFQSADWITCQAPFHYWDPIDGWSSFGDDTRRPSQRVHQLVQHWINKDRNVIAVLGLRYYSPDDWSYQDKPAGKAQHVVIVFHQSPDLERELQLLELECPPVGRSEWSGECKAAVSANDHDAAVKSCGEAAKQGDAYGQNALGIMYSEGDGVPRDEAKAAQWFTKSAEQGYVSAQHNLAWRHANGVGVPEDKTKAVEWYTKAAEQGDADSLQSLAQMYANGEGVPEDKTKAVELYTNAAEQGSAKAQFILGMMYGTGKGVTRDNAKGVEWLTRAAEQGDAPSQYVLGNMYGSGTGVPEDDDKAVEWYTKAAEQGNALAQYELCKMFYTGEGVSSNHVTAYAWCNLAAAQLWNRYPFIKKREQIGAGMTSQQIGEAQRLSSKWFEKYEAKQDVSVSAVGQEGATAGPVEECRLAIESMDWHAAAAPCATAAEQGDAEGQFYVGLMYRGSEDMSYAVAWLTKAAEQGHTMAQFTLGAMYDKGDGVPEDDAEAIEWYTMAAEQGDAEAQYKLGVMYASGKGVTEDFRRGYMWFTLAFAGEWFFPRDDRDDLEARMTAEDIAESTRMASEWSEKHKAKPEGD